MLRNPPETSRRASNSELKRKLTPAIRELEEQGFLTALTDAERFTQVRVGEWRALFVKATKKVTVLGRADAAADSLVEDLVARGITERSARKLLAHHAHEKVAEKVRLFDALKKRGGDAGIRNRAGWLYAAIVNDYTVADEVRPARPPAKTLPTPTKVVASAEEVEHVPKPEVVAFEAFWAGMLEDEKERYEAEAVAAAPAFLQKQYHEGNEAQGTLWRVTRRRILVDHHGRSA